MEGLGQLRHHGWFVVRNRSDGDDEGADFDLKQAEADLFRNSPWTQIRESRRGSTMLRKHLARLLCDKIRAAFPHLLGNIKALLDEADRSKASLGKTRDTQDLRRSYLADMAQNYETDALKALQTPWDLPSSSARIRLLAKDMNQSFDTVMRDRGHTHRFEDHDLKDQAYIEQMEQLKSDLAVDSDESPEILQMIQEEIRICSSTGLPGMAHPDVVHRLYKRQTKKWKNMAEVHLLGVAKIVSQGAKEILSTVCPASAGTAVLFEELWLILHTFYEAALSRALTTLRTYCDGDQMKLLQTTDPGFLYKLDLLKSLRIAKAYSKATELVRAESSHLSMEQLSLRMCDMLHIASQDNMSNHIHDTLKVYYEVRYPWLLRLATRQSSARACIANMDQFSLQAFIRHIVNTVIEDFLEDPNGPLKCLTRKFVEQLPGDDVDRLGQENSEVIETRLQLDGRINTLRTAEKVARAAMSSTASLD